MAWWPCAFARLPFSSQRYLPFAWRAVHDIGRRGKNDMPAESSPKSLGERLLATNCIAKVLGGGEEHRQRASGSPLPRLTKTNSTYPTKFEV